MSHELLMGPRITRVEERRVEFSPLPTADQIRDSVKKSVPKIVPVMVGLKPFDHNKKIK